MRYLFFLSIIFTLYACNDQKTTETVEHSSDSTVVSSNPPPKDSLSRDVDMIQNIRNRVQAINSMNLLVQTFDWSEPGCSDQGKISFYLNKDSIAKITETGFIGDGGWTKEYYYYQGKYIFSFMQSIGGPAGMPVDTSEVREYVNNDTLVLLKRNNESHTDIKEKWNAGSKEYRLLKTLKNKNFGAVLCN